MGDSPNLKKKIFKETLIYSIGSFGSKILSFLLVPLYTFFLTKKELGEYDLLLTTISLFVPLVSLQLSDATYRWLIDNNDKNESDIKKIITNSFLGYFCSYLIFLVAFLIFNYFEPVEYSIYFVLLLFLNGLLPFLQSILRGLGNTKEFAKNGVLTSFFIVLFNILFIYFFKFKVEGILLANIVANVLACGLILYKINIHKIFKINDFNKDYLKNMLSYSVPLIPNLMSWWLIGSASKYIILHFMGAESNGLYAISSRFPSILVIINSVLIMPLQDGILKKDSNINEYRDLLINFFRLEFYLILVLILWSPIITKLVVSPNFYESWKYMGFLFIGVGLNTLGSVLGFFYLKKMNTKRVTITTIIGAIISIILSILLINDFGLFGISFAYMFGFFVMFYLRFIDTRDHLNLNISHFTIVFSILVLIILNIGIFYINFFNQILIAIIGIIIILIFNKSLIIRLIENKLSFFKKK